MCLTFMSSEESGEEEQDGVSNPVIYVKSLPWRHTSVLKFFKQIDAKIDQNKTRRAKMQTMKRLPGTPSTHPPPVDEFGESFWAFSDVAKRGDKL